MCARQCLLKRKDGDKEEKVEIEAILTQIKAEGILAVVQPLQEELPDRDDEPFLEAVLAVNDTVLVTGNKKDFPLPSGSRIFVFAPGEFIAYRRMKYGV